jgi:hypothetical protein
LWLEGNNGPDMGNFMEGISHTNSLTLKEESGGFVGKGG